MNRVYNLKAGGKPGAVNTTLPTLRQVANRTFIMQAKHGSHKYARGRRGHKLNTAVTQLSLVYGAWYASLNANATPFVQELNSAFINYAASVEYPVGTFNQVLFSGQALFACGAGNEITGVVDVTIPADTIFYIHTRMDVPNGTIICSGNASNSTQPNSNVSHNDWGDSTDASASALTDITMTGVGYSRNFSILGQAIGPHLILGMSNKPAVINYGSANDYGETGILTAAYGAVGQVCQSLDKAKMAYVCASSRSDTYEVFVTNSAKRVAMAKYFQYAVFGGAITDLTNGRTSTQIIGYLQATWALFTGLRLIQCLTAPLASGTTGQTQDAAINPQRVALRAALLGSQPALYGKFDVGVQLEGTADSGVWSQTVSLTNAGISPNAAGYQKIVDSGVIDVTILKPY